MSLTIHPDPQEPAGGFAFLELPAGTLTADTAMVAVFEVFGERWLAPSEGGGTVGDPHWQSERHDFGPYTVHRHDGADWLRIGPEIVNKIDEYTPLRLSVGDLTQDVTWPDDVPPRAGAAVLGGIQAAERAQTKAPSAQPVLKRPAPPPEQPKPESAPPEPVAPKRNLLIPVLLGLAVLGAILMAFLLIPGDEPTVETDCSDSGMRAMTGGFAATEKAIRACGSAISADTVLKLVEDASERDDPDALLLFGTLYDGAELDQRIEKEIGLSFDHDATKAAEYYARAAGAGSETARPRLVATCAQLAGSNLTLAKGAYDDFCR